MKSLGRMALYLPRKSREGSLGTWRGAAQVDKSLERPSRQGKQFGQKHKSLPELPKSTRDFVFIEEQNVRQGVAASERDVWMEVKS